MIEDGVAMQRIGPSLEENNDGEIEEEVEQVEGKASCGLKTEQDVTRARTIIPTVEVELDNK